MIKTVLLMICIMFNSSLIAKDLPLACSESELSWLKEKINRHLAKLICIPQQNHGQS